MHACFMRNHRLAVIEMADPRPEAGQVLVRTLACGICGTDLHFLHHAETITELNDRLLPSLGPAALGQTHVDPSRDVFMGHEFCAEVLELGPGTIGPEPSTRVVSVPAVLSGSQIHRLAYSNDYPCGYAQQMLLSAGLVIPVPDHVDSHHAALTEPLAVGMHAVAKSELRPGDTAVVVGCGPVGLAVIASLRLARTEVIVASDFSPRRRALATSMGATRVVDPLAEPVIDAWRSVAGDQPVVIFEAVGVPGRIEEILLDAPVGARVTVAGVCMEPDTVIPFFAIAKELSLQFVVAYTVEEFALALSAIADGRVDVASMITGAVPLPGMPGAFEALRHPDDHCKILVEPNAA